MSNQNQPSTDIPSTTSIWGMGLITGIAGLLTVSIVATGGDFDWKHTAGFLLGLLATALLMMQTGNRSHIRNVLIQANRRTIENVGTWKHLTDGAEVYFAVSRRSNGTRVLMVGGSLPLGVPAGDIGLADARNVVRSMESSEWSPVRDEGTVEVRTMLMLPWR